MMLGMDLVGRYPGRIDFGRKELTLQDTKTAILSNYEVKTDKNPSKLSENLLINTVLYRGRQDSAFPGKVEMIRNVAVDENDSLGNIPSDYVLLSMWNFLL